MVQRKAPDKLGFQASSYVKSDKRSNGENPMNSDVRNKGGGSELKKIMKKSRSVKRTELDNSGGSYPVRKPKPQSNKSPGPGPGPGPASTPKKPSPDASPNYMKSTACSSNARKERSQVSPQGSKTGSETRKLFTDSHQKPVKALTKTSSLKPVRTLTKTSSKAGRAPPSSMKRKSGVGRTPSSMKTQSGVALHPNQNVERATCSSTLKDSKFPTYVMLHPGGTESDGISVIKVCPYTYCSLNGHHHPQLPPLKHFLTARRRMLKTQKSMRLKNQSPVGTNCRGERKQGTGKMVFHGDHPTPEEAGLDYFVEIYAPPREETGDADGAIDETDGGKEAEELPDKSLHSEISYEDNLDRYSEFLVTEMDISMVFSEQSPLQADEEVKIVIPAESDMEESNFEAMDMDWEEGQAVEQHFDYEADGGDDTSKIEFSIKGSSEEESNILNGENHQEEPTAASGEKYEISEPDHSACSIDVDYDTQMEEQEEYNSPELETKKNGIVFQEEPEIDVEAGCDDETQVNDQLANVEGGAEEKIQGEDSYGSCQVFCESNQDGRNGGKDVIISTSSEGNNDSERNKLKSVEQSNADNANIQTEYKSEIDAEEPYLTASHVTAAEDETTIINEDGSDSDELSENQKILNRRIRSKRPTEELEDPRAFNPRGPHFLPVVPDPEGETVDLRHQMMDERKNAEEWMVDFALRQTVNKLGPARKRRVALLVEAFETVIPIPKYESRLPHTPTAFAPARFIQACN